VFQASLEELLAVSEEVIVARTRFDPEKCQKEIFALLPAILLAGLFTKLSRVQAWYSDPPHKVIDKQISIIYT
jgi:hypothetical protein